MMGNTSKSRCGSSHRTSSFCRYSYHVYTCNFASATLLTHAAQRESAYDPYWTPPKNSVLPFREVQPRRVEEVRLWGGAPSPASVELLLRELNARSPEYYLRAAPIGEPFPLTLDRFQPDGLGAVPDPVITFYSIASNDLARRVAVHGSGCMSRRHATRETLVPATLVHQFVGQTLWLHWPNTPRNQLRLETAGWTEMVEKLQQLHYVVLLPGECMFMQSMSSYMTFSLGYDGTSFAAHFKYDLASIQRPPSAVYDMNCPDYIWRRSGFPVSQEANTRLLGPQCHCRFQTSNTPPNGEIAADSAVIDGYSGIKKGPGRARDMYILSHLAVFAAPVIEGSLEFRLLAS
ncbi:hypothetical protein BKA62DRAFT_656714 [Auriculariales sp. MPI-PUGE-AT-0066]|nr:hypothetical protein BKA62DRAFT_656714 [Auriculariales sp. MPI-PUGE-AT-0066]